MLNKTLKSIAAVLISLAVLAGSVPAVVAAEITEPAVTEPIVTEPAVTEPIVTEPVPGETTLPVDNSGELSSDPTVTDPSMTDPVTDPAVIDPALPGAETDLPLANDDIARPVFAVQWGMLPMYMGSNGVFQWSVALDNGGYYIYTVTNMYESAQFTISYDEDGDELLRYEANTQPVILDSLWNPIPGAYVQSYVENNTRYSEIYIPQSFFKDIMFTITCGQSVNSLDITDSFGMPAMPAIWGDVATLEEPVAGDSSDSAFIAQTESVISNPNNGAGSWGMTYENGNYCLYIKGNIWSCQAQFNLCDGNGGYLNHLGVSATPNYVSFNYNGTDIPVSNMVKGGDNSLYVKFVIPNGVFPDDFQLDPQNGNPKITSQQIKANGSVTPIEPEDPTIAAIKEKLGESKWAVELGSDGAYHLYIVDTSNDNPTVTVTNKATEETSSPILSQVISSEKDGLRYSEYTLSELPEWFDISYNGAIKTFGTNPEQAFIDNVTANSGGNWNAVLNVDGTCSIYVVSDTQPTAGEFTFENHIGGDGIYIDEAQTVSVLDPASGRYYTQLAVSNASDWFNVTYNGVTQTVGDNPDQAVIDRISKKVGSGSWKAEKDADGKIHIYIVDGVGDEVNISATDNAEGIAIDLSSMQSAVSVEYDGTRYTEYVVDINSDWFDISYNSNVMTIGSKIDEDTRPFLEIAKEQTADGAGDGRDGNNISGWGAVKRSDGYHIYIANSKDIYYYRTLLKSTKYDTIIMIDSNSNNIQYGERNVVSEAPINDEVDPETGTRYREFLIPFDRMPESFDITGNDKVVYLDNNTGIPPIYSGIVIDGNFTDWNALEKIPVEEKKADGSKKEFGVDHMTAVWDGDRVYIYVDTKDKNYSALFTAGPNNNGVYKITTDLNRTLLIQARGPYDNPVVYGVEGAEIKVDTTGTLTAPHYMEISFPASELPTFHNSISVGIYGDNERVITISDLRGTVDPTPASEIVIDGDYYDWTYYPHTLIAYDTPGIQLDLTKKCDGEQALISHGDEVYGHCVTQHAEHLKETLGGMWEFNISVNNSYLKDPENPDFKARFLCVGSDGRLHTVREYNGAAMFAENAANLGQPYHYYLIDVSDGSCEGMTVEEFEASGKKYGEAYVTHSPSQWDIEYKLSVEKLAEIAGLQDATDVKSISSQFHMIGPEWVTTAGTSTGAFLGIFLCLATVSGTYFFKKKKAMGIK